MAIRIAPSILAADYAALADEVRRVEAEADMIHVDVMDGHFVPNLTIGPPVVASLRRHTERFLDCHLMVDRPLGLLEPLAEAGADGVSIHVELGDPTPALGRIRDLGLQVGLVVNPPTPIETVVPYLHLVDLLLVMSVQPGRGGQAFIPEVLAKVVWARRFVDEEGLPVSLQIDGGINEETARSAAAAGVDILVAGSAIYGSPDALDAARRIRRAAEGARRAGTAGPEGANHPVA